MNSDKEIEETFYKHKNSSFAQYLRDNFENIGIKWDKSSFTAGAKWVHEKIMSEASEGFEEWYTEDHASKIWSDLNGDEIAKETWQAAKLSSAKEIEQLRTKIEQERSHIRTCHIAMEGHHKEIEQLKQRLKNKETKRLGKEG